MICKMLTFIVFHFFCLSMFAQTIENISVDFERTHNENNKIEITKGKIYFKFPDNLYIKVDTPVNQILNFNKKKLEIFYPEYNQAFLISNNNPMNIPFFQSFISVIKEDNGLSELGFKMTSNEFIDDILITVWKPPKELETIINKFILTYNKNKLLNSRAQNSKGKFIVSTIYKNHFEYKDIYFPLEIIIKRNFENSVSVEKVTYTNLKFDFDFPEEIINFTIPENAEIKEVNW